MMRHYFPYWLRGALILFFLFLPLLFVNETSQFFLIPLALIWWFPFALPVVQDIAGRLVPTECLEQVPGSIGVSIGDLCFQTADTLLRINIVTILIYVALGAALGLIYGKLKDYVLRNDHSAMPPR